MRKGGVGGYSCWVFNSDVICAWIQSRFFSPHLSLWCSCKPIYKVREATRVGDMIDKHKEIKSK